MVRRLTDFTVLRGFDQVLSRRGLFQTAEYLRLFAQHFIRPENTILLGVFSQGQCLGYAAFERLAGRLLFLGMKPVLGGEELSDYGEIVARPGKAAAVWQEILLWLSSQGFKRLQLDYVREDSDTYRFFKDKKGVKLGLQAVAPFINLPRTWEEYLGGLKRDSRKELKRKLLKWEASAGSYFFSRESGVKEFNVFIKLFRLSGDSKKRFMSQAMVRFFRDLLKLKPSGWRSELSWLSLGSKPVAGLFSFVSPTEVWVYNSGFDPAFGLYSPGVLLHAYRIKAAIKEKKKRYDFMRGTERYKYELGGQDQKLFRIELRL
jgi:hypothetical protein